MRYIWSYKLYTILLEAYQVPNFIFIFFAPHGKLNYRWQVACLHFLFNICPVCDLIMGVYNCEAHMFSPDYWLRTVLLTFRKVSYLDDKKYNIIFQIFVYWRTVCTLRILMDLGRSLCLRVQSLSTFSPSLHPTLIYIYYIHGNNGTIFKSGSGYRNTLLELYDLL